VTLSKAGIAQKIGNDCGFMKNETAEVLEKLLDVITNRRGCLRCDTVVFLLLSIPRQS